MLWDVFCRVIDNFGDIGVCWRLATDLGQRGHQVRLWVDDAQALSWMAPQVQWRPDPLLELVSGQGQAGVTVHHWANAERALPDLPGLLAADVVIEAFGCDPPDAFVQRMQVRAALGQPSCWINLEYLSAQDYVERSHGLASPVWSGAGSGLHKRFFYPGFTPATGGLLREPGMIDLRQAQTDGPALRQAVLAELGIATQPAEQTVLVFCYDHAPLGGLLDRLQQHHAPVHVLLTPGPASRLGAAWRPAAAPSGLRLHNLPHLPQPVFDRLLWCTDLNFVRGEDSAVQALWAARPHVWQIYEQDDGVHASKLDAFMARWMADWPPDLRADVSAWWRAWNLLGPIPEALPAWGHPDTAWHRASQAARAPLRQQTDLVTQLIQFVTSSG